MTKVSYNFTYHKDADKKPILLRISLSIVPIGHATFRERMVQKKIEIAIGLLPGVKYETIHNAIIEDATHIIADKLKDIQGTHMSLSHGKIDIKSVNKHSLEKIEQDIDRIFWADKIDIQPAARSL